MREGAAAGRIRRLLAIVPAQEATRVERGAELAGLEVTLVHELGRGLALSRQGWTAILLSFSLEPADSALAARLAGQPDAPPLLLATAGAGLDAAVGARAAGATAILREPIDPDALAAELARLEAGAGSVALPEPPPEGARTPLLGSSPSILRSFDTIARVADTPATVLLIGESGTGKELVARALHEGSARRKGPFVPVNCAAIPEGLLESELFGHERGAFTGAIARRAGRFERASGGTLFLDEIGDMSLVLQAKLLRVLEERVVERVGGGDPIHVDVRVVAATHRSLPERIRTGEFREDLFYRLAVITVELPPLRERPEDVVPLALYFASHFARTYARPVRRVSQEAIWLIRRHPWPGNVRELRNVMDRAVILCRGETVAPEDLLLGDAAPRGSPKGGGEEGVGFDATLSLAEVEARHIRAVLRQTGGHLIEAARILGIHRNTLTRKLREYRINT